MVQPPEVVDELRAMLAERRREAAERMASLRRSHQEIVDAVVGANVDDEHDPEGSTIAFERIQVDTLAKRAAEDIEEADAALARLDAGSYGVCERCGEQIPVGRLRARPAARTCVRCAGGR